MGSSKLDTLTKRTETSGIALSATPLLASPAIRRTRQENFNLDKHLNLLQQIEELRVATGHNHGEADGVTNGTTAVEIVASPDTGFIRRVESILVYNVDSVDATVFLQKNNGSAVRVFHRETLTTLTVLGFTSPIVLSAADSLEIDLLANVTTTELDWVVSWRDYDVL